MSLRDLSDWWKELVSGSGKFTCSETPYKKNVYPSWKGLEWSRKFFIGYKTISKMFWTCGFGGSLQDNRVYINPIKRGTKSCTIIWLCRHMKNLICIWKDTGAGGGRGKREGGKEGGGRSQFLYDQWMTKRWTSAWLIGVQRYSSAYFSRITKRSAHLSLLKALRHVFPSLAQEI